MKKTMITFIAFGFFSSLLGSWFIYKNFILAPASPFSKEVIFEIAPKSNLPSIIKGLYEHELIKFPLFFSFYVRFHGDSTHIKTGEYLLDTNMNPQEILTIITSGRSIQHTITITDGMNIYEISDLIEKLQIAPREQFLTLVKDEEFIKSALGESHESLEGYLFPETYSYTKYTTLKELLLVIIKKFTSVYADLVEKYHFSTTPIYNDWTRHQIVTLASIIEKETGAPSERKLISSVFHNRLSKKILLQTDPTVLYGKTEKTKKIEMNITKEDLTQNSRYNTYIHAGLPPGPIANPGREALVSVFLPEPSEFLYFVSQNQGTHFFSKTYEEHLRAVKDFQLHPKSREGKSWRDLKDPK